MNNNRQKQLISRNRRRATARHEEAVGIPKFLSDPVITWVTRLCIPKANSSDTVSNTQELPIFPWGMSTSTTTMRLPFKAVRLAKVCIWADYRESVGIGGNTINLTFVERRGVRPIEMSDTATYARCAFIKWKAPKTGDPLGLYYITTASETNPEIRFQITKGSVLELTYNYVLSDGLTVPLALTPTSGLTADLIYTNCLNTTDFEPIGRASAAAITG
jgi:hypothetical protein